MFKLMQAFVRLFTYCRPSLVTFYFVIFFEFFFSIEWTYPSCGRGGDGTQGIFGMPFPYAAPRYASSLDHDALVHIFILNLAVLYALAYPLIRFILRKDAGFRNTFQKIFSTACILLFMIILPFRLALLTAMYPVTTLDKDVDYFTYRPAKFGIMNPSNRKFCYK